MNSSTMDVKKVNVWFLLVCFLTISENAFSQKNYVSGYIVSLEGDTIKGLVDYRNWDNNPEEISFKIDEESKIRKYSPKMIKEFGTSNEKYISSIVNIERSPRLQGKVLKKSELVIERDTVFLRSLILGVKSLLAHKSWDGIENFYIQIDNEYVLLKYKRYLKEVSSKLIEVEVKDYILQLKSHFSDCESIQGAILSLRYDQSNLENIFKQYYLLCSSNDILFKPKKDRLTVELNVIGGLTNTTLDLVSGSGNHDYLIEAGYTNSIDFVLGIRLDVLLPRNRKKFSFNNELLFTRFKFDGEYNDFVRENNFSIINTSLQYSHLKVINTVKYRYLLNNSNFYVNTGLSSGFVFQETNERVDNITFQSVKRTERRNAIEFTRSGEFGWVLGGGWIRKRISVELRYERAGGISNIASLKAATNRTYILFGFEL